MRTDKVVLYQGADEQWYWTYQASNGKKRADGSEGYRERNKALAGAAEVCDFDVRDIEYFPKDRGLYGRVGGCYRRHPLEVVVRP